MLLTNKIIKKNKKGFTLIELIVTMTIIAVLSAIIVPTSLHFVRKAEKEEYFAFVDSFLSDNIKVEYDRAYGENKTDVIYILQKIAQNDSESYNKYSVVPVYRDGLIDGSSVDINNADVQKKYFKDNESNINTFKSGECVTVYIGEIPKKDAAGHIIKETISVVVDGVLVKKEVKVKQLVSIVRFYNNGKYQNIEKINILKDQTEHIV